jgi:hypothetical protein
MTRTVYLTSDVFVAGSSPVITYNPRDARQQEQELERYEEQGTGRALTVSGPSKSGKTVLIERRLPRDEAIWIEGPDVTDVGVLWHRVVDWLGLYDLIEVGRAEDATAGKQYGLAVGSDNIAKATIGKTGDTKNSTSVRKSRTSDVTTLARKALEDWGTPIVIDDFHSVAEDAKTDLARAIKTIILHSKVILVAVPHEAFDVVRHERDMDFRVEQLRIEPWSQQELEFIAERGFEALAITDSAGVGSALASASYGAPFLMQQLCYDYARLFLGVRETPRGGHIEAVEPESWKGFLGAVADRMPSDIFADLLKGPKERGTRRQVRTFHDGSTTDIYGVVLYAIARTGNLQATLAQIGEEIEASLLEPPTRQQIGLSLGHMGTIARNRQALGDPALAYKDEVLNILDPFLLFYLRYGSYTLQKDMSRPNSEQATLEMELEPADPANDE